jgi:hypothetical protein
MWRTVRSEFFSTHLSIAIGIEAGKVSLGPRSLEQFSKRSKLTQ